MKYNDFLEFISTISHLEVPPDFTHQDTSAYTLSAEFFSSIAKELDILLKKEWESIIATSAVNTPGFASLLSFTDYVNDYLAPEFASTIESIEAEQEEAYEATLSAESTEVKPDDT